MLAAAISAGATLPPWLQHVVGASSIEAALFRAMALPGTQAMYPRPPKEAQGELAKLIAGAPDDSQLYALRAQTDEAALDFAAAEADWKQSVARSKDAVNAKLELADFYRRRMMVAQELQTLGEVGAAPAIAAERFVDPAKQRSWMAFDRMLGLIAEQGLPAAQTAATLQAFVARYPEQPAVYARLLGWQMNQKAWPDAEASIERYKKAFPQDQVFPIRAQALLEYRRGNIDQALAVYDRSFQPLWPAPLVQSYFGLLATTHRQRAFVADARTRLAQHPDGPEALNAVARIFYYDQQAGRLDKAQQTIDGFRIDREARNGAWSANDLYTLAALTNSTHSYAESARYDFALASTTGTLPDGEVAAQAGLSGLVHLLLTAPDQPIALGAGNLTLYRDIATVDQGPGYWNGILSLWLNGTSPEREYQTETAKAQSYFHRAKAAELLADLDSRFPAAPERAGLHAELIRTYEQYGESDAVIAAGKEFLAAFPASTDRVEMAGLMADAYARKKDTAGEFTLYDSLLTELAAKTNGLPLTAGAPPPAPDPRPRAVQVNPEADGVPDANESEDATSAPTPVAVAMKAASYDLTSYAPLSASIPEAVAYARVLDRYLGRLVAEGQIPQALTVLRRQLDQNPNEPMLYEKLANFLQQNNLSQQQEEVYKLAIAKFQQPTWYDKLARVYLRERNREAYTTLTHQVTDIFAGTEVDAWFAHLSTAGFNQPGQGQLGAQLALQLNLYAQKRYPHDVVLTRNLAAAYATRPTANNAALEDLLRKHWWEDESLRNRFFVYLSRTGKLQAEMAQLNTLAGATANVAATRELAEADIWTSHFEQAAPLMSAVADLYPADAGVGDSAVSLFRSLAYLDASSASTARAVALEQQMLDADPANANRLATLGDLYAEATSTGGEDIATAGPYWRRIPAIHAGTPAGYLTAATIFWDYFQFDDAMAQLKAARTRFHEPALFGYEAGAIEENRHDMQAAIAEYAAVAAHPPGDAAFMASLHAAVGAYLRPPSDAADSELWSTTQSLFNAAAARSRLIQLATRPATSALVDKATAQAVAASPTPVALTLRADVLLVQHRQAELAPLLEQALARAKTADEAAAIGDLARTHSLNPVNGDAQLREVSVNLSGPERVERNYAPSGSYALASVYEHALEKQIELSGDPVEKIELNYTLSASLEGRRDTAGAAKIIDRVYRENPRILGVVRATTDFYARNSQPPKAIATLLEASKVATPELARNFTLEAAQKANDANDTQQARALAEGLLKATPYDATVLGIIATSYARANDDAGLKEFYVAQLAAVKTATLTAEERRQDTALLRRGLIPALTRMKDYQGAVDQYIALLSAYPEDSSTAQEAALYGLRYSRQTQLLDFLRTTVKQSPRDSRFAILLAQVETTFEDLPAAVAAYTQAIAIRKDRADLYSARVDLELRLGQDDRAVDDFNRLYVLSYKDPAWMVRLAELRARQQRPADAVKALETAYITGQPASAANQFRVAESLARWNLLDEARTFAEQGLKLAGPKLLTPESNGEAATYARILTRLGKPDDALAALGSAYRAVESNASLPAELAAGYAKAHMPAQDIEQARKQYVAQRVQVAKQQLDQAVTAMGQTVQMYYTPEQKLMYAQTLDRLHDAAQPGANPALALTAATAAGLADREAEYRKQHTLSGMVNIPDQDNLSAYAMLERRRLAFAELAQTDEAYAARLRPEMRAGPLADAAQAWRDAGDETNEMRVTRPLVLAQNTALRDRYFDLLLRHDRAALIALAANKDTSLADAAANYAAAHATQAQALSAIAQRGRGLEAVWRPAMASLVLTNFASPGTTTAVATSVNFTQSLNSDATIGARIGTHADPSKQLTGDLWFYYAGRFGVFLNTVPKAASLADAEDYLPAELEQAPTLPAGYLHLAREYAEAGNTTAAATEYDHALEIAPNNPAVHDEYAVVLYRANRKDDALAQWRAAMALLVKRQSGEEFFAAFKSVVGHLGERHLTAAFRPELDAILHPYLARNGNYRSNEMLRAVYEASATPAEGLELILSASNAAADPAQVLSDLTGLGRWMTPEVRESILLHCVDLERKAAAAHPTVAVPASSSESNSDVDTPDYGGRLIQVEAQLLELYFEQAQYAKAQALIDTYTAKQRKAYDFELQHILLAALTGHVDASIATYRANPDQAPKLETIAQAADSLANPQGLRKPEPESALKLRQYAFEQKQLTHQLIPTDFLSLAQSRMDTGDMAGALELLRRVTLQPPPAPAYSYENFVRGEPQETQGDPHANTDSAASLLEAAHHEVEAIPFLAMLVKAVPWNPSYRLRLAEAELKGTDAAKAVPILIEVARDAAAPYATRLKAAGDLASQTSSPVADDLNGGELTLLASTAHPTPGAARQPYFVAARIAAAVGPSVAKADRAALLREAIAIEPAGGTADKARLDLLLAQDNTANASATIGIYSAVAEAPGYLNRFVRGDQSNGDAETDNSAEETGDSSAYGSNPTYFPFSAINAYDRATQIRLAGLMASAYQRDHMPTLALYYDQLAVNIDSRNPKPDPALAKRLADMRTTIRLEKKNALRRPLIHADLDQANLIRPRQTLADLARTEAP
jgi:tetratricopeptide (TPR) repeat protein